MARFKSELPNDVIKQMDSLERNYKQIFGEMCKAGAEVVYENVINNMKKVFDSTDSLEQGLKITKVYHTPSDDGINVHVGFYGYKKGSKPTDRYPRGTPIPLIANAREYGTSAGEKKRPFFRKSFKKKQIESEMLKVQNKYIKGD